MNELSHKVIGILALYGAVGFTVVGLALMWVFTRNKFALFVVWYADGSRMSIREYDAGTWASPPDMFEVWTLTPFGNRNRFVGRFVNRIEAEGAIDTRGKYLP